MEDLDSTDRLPLTRRKLLSAGAGTATALAGLRAFAGPAAAWGRGDADLRGCSGGWVSVSREGPACADGEGTKYDELDDHPNNECPLRAEVIVADGQELECRPVYINEENATTIPGKYGDSPLVKYQVSGGEKILGVVGLSPSGTPNGADFVVNTNRCAQTPNTPSVYDADCVPNGVSEDEAESDQTNGPQRRGRGHGRGRGR